MKMAAGGNPGSGWAHFRSMAAGHRLRGLRARRAADSISVLSPGDLAARVRGGADVLRSLSCVPISAASSTKP